MFFFFFFLIVNYLFACPWAGYIGNYMTIVDNLQRKSGIEINMETEKGGNSFRSCYVCSSPTVTDHRWSDQKPVEQWRIIADCGWVVCLIRGTKLLYSLDVALSEDHILVGGLLVTSRAHQMHYLLTCLLKLWECNRRAQSSLHSSKQWPLLCWKYLRISCLQRIGMVNSFKWSLPLSSNWPLLLWLPALGKGFGTDLK